MSILAIIFGVIGVNKNGKGLAITGITTGAIGLIIPIITFIFFIYSVTNEINYLSTDDFQTSIDTNLFYSSDKAVSISYDTNKWFIQSDAGEIGGVGLALVNPDVDDYLGVIEFRESSEAVSEEEYIQILENSYRDITLEGSTYVSKITAHDSKEYSVVHTQQKKGDDVINIDTLVIFNGTKQYEFIFQSSEKYYNDCKDLALDVFRTVKILKEQ